MFLLFFALATSLVRDSSRQKRVRHHHHQLRYRFDQPRYQSYQINPIEYDLNSIEYEEGPIDFDYNDDELEANKFRVKKIVKKATHAVSHAVKSVTKPIEKAGKAVEKGVKEVGKGVEKAGKAVEKGVKEIGKGVEKVGKSVEKVGKQVEKVGKQVEKGVKEVGKGVEKVGKQVEKTTKKVTKVVKASIKSSLRVVQATAHITQGVVRISVAPHHAARILKETGRRLGKDAKRFKEDFKPIVHVTKQALKVLKKIAPYIGPVLAIIPGVGQIYLVAQVAYTLSTAYKAYAVYKALEGAYYGIKYHNLDAVVGGVLSTCGALGVPGVDKAAQIYHEGSMLYKAVKNKDLGMALDGLVSIASSHEAIKSWALETVGNNEFLRQGLDYYEQGKEVYKEGKNIYKAVKDGDIASALAGATTMLSDYVPSDKLQTFSDITSKVAYTASAIEKKKFGTALELIAGGANAVFHTDFTDNLVKQTATLHDISRNIKAGKIGTAYNTIASVYNITLPDNTIKEIENVVSMKNKVTDIYNELEKGHVATAYGKFAAAFNLSVPVLEKAITLEKTYQDKARTIKSAYELSKEGKYDEAFAKLNTAGVHLGRENERTILELIDTQKKLYVVYKDVKDGKYGKAYQQLHENFNITLPNEVLESVNRGIQIRDQIKAYHQQAIQIRNAAKHGNISGAYVMYVELTGTTLNKTKEQQLRSLEAKIQQFEEFGKQIKKGTFNSAQFTQLTGIKLSQSVEAKIAFANKYYADISYAKKLVDEHKYEEAIQEINRKLKLNLKPEQITKLYETVQTSVEMMNSGNATKGLVLFQQVTGINILDQYQQIVDIKSKIQQIKDIINQGKEADVNELGIKGLSNEMETYQMQEEFDNFESDLGQIETNVENGNYDAAIKIKHAPKFVKNAVNKINREIERVKEQINRNKQIIKDSVDNKLKKVLPILQKKKTEEVPQFIANFDESLLIETNEIDTTFLRYYGHHHGLKAKKVKKPTTNARSLASSLSTSVFARSQHSSLVSTPITQTIKSGPVSIKKIQPVSVTSIPAFKSIKPVSITSTPSVKAINPVSVTSIPAFKTLPQKTSLQTSVSKPVVHTPVPAPKPIVQKPIVAPRPVVHTPIPIPKPVVSKPVQTPRPVSTPVPVVVETVEVIDEQYDEKQLTAELNEVNKTCQTFLLDLITAGEILDHSLGSEIAKQATTFMSTIEQKHEESNDRNLAIKKAIANQMSYIHENGQHVNYDAPEVTSIQQLLEIIKKAKKSN